MKTEIMAFATAHPFITAGIVIVGGYGTYKLADKLIDGVTHTANHAIDARYAFEASGNMFKAGPQLAQPQAVTPQLPAPQ